MVRALQTQEPSIPMRDAGLVQSEWPGVGMLP